MIGFLMWYVVGLLSMAGLIKIYALEEGDVNIDFEDVLLFLLTAITGGVLLLVFIIRLVVFLYERYWNTFVRKLVRPKWLNKIVFTVKG